MFAQIAYHLTTYSDWLYYIRILQALMEHFHAEIRMPTLCSDSKPDFDANMNVYIYHGGYRTSTYTTAATSRLKYFSMYFIKNRNIFRAKLSFFFQILTKTDDVALSTKYISVFN